MTTQTTTAAQILAAAQKMHDAADAADDLQKLLATAGAVHARILLESLAYVRRGADDLQQFAADLAADQREPEPAPSEAARRADSRGAAEPDMLAQWCKAHGVDIAAAEALDRYLADARR